MRLIKAAQPRVHISEVGDRLGLPMAVTYLAPYRDGLFQVADAFGSADPANRLAEGVQHPRLALTVPCLPSADQRDLVRVNTVRPVAATFKNVEQRRGEPPGDVVQTAGRCLAGRREGVQLV